MAGLLLGLLLIVATLLLMAGQLGLFSGKPPQDSSLLDSRFSPLSSSANSLFSEAGNSRAFPRDKAGGVRQGRSASRRGSKAARARPDQRPRA